MSRLDKGLQLDRPSNILPKEPQPTFGNVSASVEGDIPGSHSLPPYTYQLSSFGEPVHQPSNLPYSTAPQLRSSQGVYQLHLDQYQQLNSPSRRSLSSGSGQQVVEPSKFSHVRVRFSFVHHHNAGRLIAQDSQRTLVDSPRYSSLLSTGHGVSYDHKAVVEASLESGRDAYGLFGV